MGNDKLKMEIYFVHVEYKFGFSRYFDFFLSAFRSVWGDVS